MNICWYIYIYCGNGESRHYTLRVNCSLRHDGLRQMLPMDITIIYITGETIFGGKTCLTQSHLLMQTYQVH